jgi:hypothetical protein
MAWLRHGQVFAELNPNPDQVTIAIGTTQVDILPSTIPGRPPTYSARESSQAGRVIEDAGIADPPELL